MSFLYRHLVHEDDSFAAKTRKLMAIMSFSALLLPIVTIPYLAIASASGEAPVGEPAGTGVAVALIGLVVMLLFTSLPTYFYVRCTGRAPEWLFDVLILVSNLALIPVTIGIRRFPTQPNLVLFAIWMAFSGTPRMWIHILLLSIHYLVAAYNDAVEGTVFMSLQVENAYLGHPWGLLLQQATSFVNVGCIVFIALIMYRQLVDAVLQAHTAIELAHIVADQLVHYDTEEVRKTLENYRDKCEDEELIDSFMHMADNLDEYRPYLPNWLLFNNKRGISGGGGGVVLPDEEEEEDDDDDNKTVSSIRSRTQGGDDESTIRVAIEEPDKQSARSNNSDQQSRMTAQSRASAYRQPGRKKTGGLRAGGDAYSVRSRGARSNQGGGGAHVGAAVPMNAAQAMQTRTRQAQGEVKVALGIFEFGFDKPGALTRQERTAALGRFVERVGELGTQTSGAIHSFVCGKLVVSWGAYPLPRPETKAAQFMNFLARDCGDANVYVYGAIVTGKSEVQIAGGKRQQALLVSSPWYRDAIDSAALAVKHKALVIDHKTRLIAKADWETRIFDGILCPVFGTAGAVPDTADTDSRGATDSTPQIGLPPMDASANPQTTSPGAGDINVVPGLENDVENLKLDPVHIDGRIYSPLVLHTISKARPQTEHDEWLYEIEKKKNLSPEDAVIMAIFKAMNGDFNGALEKFDAITETAILDEEHVKRVYERTKVYAANGGRGMRSFAQRLSNGI